MTVLGLTVAAAQALACGPYRVALYEYGSLAYQAAGSAPAGIDVDVVREVSRRTGCRFETFMDSRVRTWTELAEGRLDMTVSGEYADAGTAARLVAQGRDAAFLSGGEAQSSMP